MYRVEVKVIGGFTTHSEHSSYRDAVDQADMVRGRVVCSTGMPDESAFRYAKNCQGFAGDFASWQSQDDCERDGYESGANPAGV